MKNICFLIGNLNHSGGTERVTSLIANALALDKYNIFILSLVDGNQPFFDLENSIETNSLFSQKISMKKFFFETVKRIRQFLKKHKIDTLIVVDSVSCVFTVPACLGLKINHICWEHFNLKVNLGSRFRDLGRWMATKWCTKIITLTERDKVFWDTKFNLFGSQKVIAIANPSPYTIQHNIPLLSDKSILCAGRLTYQKGFDLLIPAWAKIAEELPDWKVTIVGSGEDEQMLKKMAESLGVTKSIIFAGQQKDMDQFYRKASFFCMSSRFEGLPMVLLEAQSYGLPIVSLDCDTGPAEIVDSGENGFLAGAENVDDLSLKILQLCKEEDFEDFCKCAFEKSLKFNMRNIIAKWINVI